MRKYNKGGLLAPNGKPSNLNAEQYKLVRTPEFKSWFGDWENDPENASKVVDDNGEPLVVYHGTLDGRFTIFDKRKFGTRTKNKNSIAFFFTPDLWYAKAYSESANNQRIKQFEEMFGRTPNAIEPRPYAEEKVCFLNIRNPKNVQSQTIDDILLAQKESHDGIFLWTKDNTKVYEIAVFMPNQIKLADGTNRNFDKTNPDIRFEKGGLIAPNGKPSNLNTIQYDLVRTKSFKDWFGDWENDPQNSSKVLDENGEPLVVYHGTYVNNPFFVFDFDKADLGFHFGTYEQAKNRSETKPFFANKKSTINPFFLNIKTLFYASDIGEWEYPQRYIDMLIDDNIITEKEAKDNKFYQAYYREDNKGIRDFIMHKYGDYVGFEYNNKHEGDGLSYIVLNESQIKLADGTNTTFDKNSNDIRYEQGGEVKIDKILSSSSRFKPSEVIVFDPPLIGTNGNKLISYEWKYDWESRTSREGDEYGKRISDWTQAEESAETGRDLVHIYTIELPDKSIKNVSSESVLVLLGLVEKEQKKIFGNIATASKTLAKQQMKLAILEAQAKQYKEAKETLEKAEKPQIKIAKFDELQIVIRSVFKREGNIDEIFFLMGDVIAPQQLPYTKVINIEDYDNLSISQYPPTKNTIENLESRWVSKRLDELNLRFPSDLYNLKNRVERQTKKVQNMIKVDSFAKGGVIESNKKVGWSIFGFVVGILTLGTINSK